MDGAHDIGDGSASKRRPTPRLVAAFRIITFVLLLSPPIGGLPISLYMSVVGALTGNWDSIGDLAKALLFVSLMSYVFGGIPALIASIWLASTLRPGQPLSYARALAIGAGSAAPLAVLLIFAMPGMAGPLLGCALFAAIGCRALAGWVGLLPIPQPSDTAHSSDRAE